MTIEEAIYRKLADSEAVVALAGDHLYPVLPKNGPPAGDFVVWNKITSSPEPTHGEPVGLRFDLYQFACFSDTAKGAADLASVLIAALDGQEIGTSGNATLDDERDSYDQDADLYRRDVDVRI